MSSKEEETSSNSTTAKEVVKKDEDEKEMTFDEIIIKYNIPFENNGEIETYKRRIAEKPMGGARGEWQVSDRITEFFGYMMKLPKNDDGMTEKRPGMFGFLGGTGWKEQFFHMMICGDEDKLTFMSSIETYCFEDDQHAFFVKEHPRLLKVMSNLGPLGMVRLSWYTLPTGYKKGADFLHASRRFLMDEKGKVFYKHKEASLAGFDPNSEKGDDSLACKMLYYVECTGCFGDGEKRPPRTLRRMPTRYYTYNITVSGYRYQKYNISDVPKKGKGPIKWNTRNDSYPCWLHEHKGAARRYLKKRMDYLIHLYGTLSSKFKHIFSASDDKDFGFKVMKQLYNFGCGRYIKIEMIVPWWSVVGVRPPNCKDEEEWRFIRHRDVKPGMTLVICPEIERYHAVENDIRPPRPGPPPACDELGYDARFEFYLEDDEEYIGDAWFSDKGWKTEKGRWHLAVRIQHLAPNLVNAVARDQKFRVVRRKTDGFLRYWPFERDYAIHLWGKGLDGPTNKNRKVDVVNINELISITTERWLWALSASDVYDDMEDANWSKRHHMMLKPGQATAERISDEDFAKLKRTCDDAKFGIKVCNNDPKNPEFVIMACNTEHERERWMDQFDNFFQDREVLPRPRYGTQEGLNDWDRFPFDEFYECLDPLDDMDYKLCRW